MLSDRPVWPAPESLGRLHSGPWMRGNSTNSTSISGIASAKILMPNLKRCSRGGTAPVYWNDNCVVRMAIKAKAIITAVPMDCE